MKIGEHSLNKEIISKSLREKYFLRVLGKDLIKESGRPAKFRYESKNFRPFASPF